jgi:tetratricopeptide (TPR) repeat protein
MTYFLHAQYIAVEPEIYLQDPTEVLIEDSAVGYIRRAGARRDKGRFDEAIADYNEALAREPKNVDIYRMKVVTYYQQGDLVAASNTFLTIADLFEESGDIQRATAVRQMVSVGLPPSRSSL